LPAARYAVLLHATSADTKLWPEDHWAALHKYLFLNNIISILPWGNVAERIRSERLAGTMPNAIVPPAMGLEAMAALLAQAQTVVGVDTGLTHLAAALNVPTVGIYCATDPAATGIHACPRAVNLGGIAKPPAAQAVITALQQLGVT
jgi:heptosyltransferase-1